MKLEFFVQVPAAAVLTTEELLSIASVLTTEELLSAASVLTTEELLSAASVFTTEELLSIAAVLTTEELLSTAAVLLLPPMAAADPLVETEAVTVSINDRRGGNVTGGLAALHTPWIVVSVSS